MAQAGFKGPATVFEGHHGLFHGFANTTDGNFEAMMKDFGQSWIWTTIAFKPYACGTMAHPFIDCARLIRQALAQQNLALTEIDRIECDTAEGIVHRLWEPLSLKHSPPNAYAAKFSIPYAIAAGLMLDDAGLEAYTEAVVQGADIRALASKVSYIVDPHNPYPQQFTGHVRVHLKNGQVLEQRQGFFKGGVDHPMSDADLLQKFKANCKFGGLDVAQTDAILAQVNGLFKASTVALTSLAVK
jgi:2-methylcitrate dehydratase PrpD